MSSTQSIGVWRARLAGAALAGLLALSACSLFRPHAPQASAASAPAAALPESAAPAGPSTVTDTLEGPEESADTTTVLADAGPALKPNAPKSYVVVRGDTLWGIANMFLRDPWSWPEIWYVNPQIQNPHRIYPGDTLRLALGSNGRTSLQLVRGERGLAAAARLHPLLRSSPLDTPIEAIPYSIISAFLSHPAVLTAEQVKSAAYIVALPEHHDVAGSGGEVFVKELAAPSGSRYSVMHVDEPLVNPDNGHRLGYMAIYTGTAEITRPGKISEAVLTDSARETLQGDVLIPEEHGSTADFIPHIPEHAVAGRIVAVVDNVLLAGQNQVVAINRGSSDGLERGNVLTADQAVSEVPDPCANIENTSTCWKHLLVRLPTDTAGTLLIFKTYPHLSYALILEDSVPMQVGDRVRAP